MRMGKEKHGTLTPTLCLYPSYERLYVSTHTMEELWPTLTDDERHVVLTASLVERGGVQGHSPVAVPLTSPAGVTHICAVWADDEVWVELPSLVNFCPHSDGTATRGYYTL